MLPRCRQARPVPALPHPVAALMSAGSRWAGATLMLAGPPCAIAPQCHRLSSLARAVPLVFTPYSRAASPAIPQCWRCPNASSLMPHRCFHDAGRLVPHWRCPRLALPRCRWLSPLTRAAPWPAGSHRPSAAPMSPALPCAVTAPAHCCLDASRLMSHQHFPSQVISCHAGAAPMPAGLPLPAQP